ncbi:MAG: hypothetical protein J0L58_02670 [Burkholderiales bacterium]|nr:hypothetical protein [Burkholderiales bacterium]
MLDQTLSNQGGLKGAVKRGLSVLDEWVASGVLVDAPDSATKWHRQGREDLAPSGGLFTVGVRGRRYFVSTMLEVEPAQSAAICQALQPLSDTEMAIFWLRAHGALGGQTASEAVKGGGFERVRTLAEATSAQARAELALDGA